MISTVSILLSDPAYHKYIYTTLHCIYTIKAYLLVYSQEWNSWISGLAQVQLLQILPMSFPESWFFLILISYFPLDIELKNNWGELE